MVLEYFKGFIISFVTPVLFIILIMSIIIDYSESFWIFTITLILTLVSIALVVGVKDNREEKNWTALLDINCQGVDRIADYKYTQKVMARNYVISFDDKRKKIAVSEPKKHHVFNFEELKGIKLVQNKDQPVKVLGGGKVTEKDVLLPFRVSKLGLELEFKKEDKTHRFTVLFHDSFFKEMTTTEQFELKLRDAIKWYNLLMEKRQGGGVN